MDENATVNTDPAWEMAMDWLLRMQAQPQDEALRQACIDWQNQAPEHARAWRKAQRVWQLSGEVPAQHADQWQTPAAHLPRLPARRRRRFLPLAGAALAACLIMTLSMLLPATGWRTGTGEYRVQALNDGSTVTLNAGSRLQDHSSAEQRRVSLNEGGAFFEIAPDPDRPFVVEVGNTRIEVLGTAFDVFADANDLSLSVEHGSVRVSDDLLRSELLDTPLLAGERLRLDRRLGTLQRDRLPPRQIGAWRDNLLIAQNDRIGGLVQQLRHHSPGLILMQDGDLSAHRVTGAYRLDNPVAALRAMVEPYGGRVETYGPWLMVVRR